MAAAEFLDTLLAAVAAESVSDTTAGRSVLADLNQVQIQLSVPAVVVGLIDGVRHNSAIPVHNGPNQLSIQLHMFVDHNSPISRSS